MNYTRRAQEASSAFPILSDEWMEELFRIGKECGYTDEQAEFYADRTKKDFSAHLITDSSDDVLVKSLKYLINRLSYDNIVFDTRIRKLEAMISDENIKSGNVE